MAAQIPIEIITISLMKEGHTKAVLRNLARDQEVEAVITTLIETETLLLTAVMKVETLDLLTDLTMIINKTEVQILTSPLPAQLIQEKGILKMIEEIEGLMREGKTRDLQTIGPLPLVETNPPVVIRPSIITALLEIKAMIDVEAALLLHIEAEGTQVMVATKEITSRVDSLAVAIEADSEEVSVVETEVALEVAAVVSVEVAITKIMTFLTDTLLMRKLSGRVLPYLQLKLVVATEIIILVISLNSNLINNNSTIIKQAIIKVVLLRINNHLPITNKNNERTLC
jgi:hypothetical protein